MKHGDNAVSHLIRAAGEGDSRQRGEEVRIAQVYSALHLADKVDELVAMLRDVARAEWRARHLKPEERERVDGERRAG